VLLLDCWLYEKSIQEIVPDLYYIEQSAIKVKRTVAAGLHNGEWLKQINIWVQ
jgi:hypothetical protein